MRTDNIHINMLLKMLIMAAAILIMSLFVQPAYADDELNVDNGLPVVYLTIDESRGTIKDMNTDPDHTICREMYSIKGTLVLQ